MNFSLKVTDSFSVWVDDIYFSVAIAKYHDQDNLRKKKSIWPYSSRGIRLIMVGEHGSK